MINLKSFPHKILGLSCVLLMVQAYLFAPLQPSLSDEFNSAWTVLAIPAFAIPFAISAAGMALMSVRVNAHRWLITSSLILSCGTLLMNIVDSVEGFLILRMITGFGSGLILPSSILLANAGNREYKPTGMAYIMFSLAAGMTFGPSLGGWLNDVLGWRQLYQVTGMLSAMLCLFFFTDEKSFASHDMSFKARVSAVAVLPSGSTHTFAFIYLTGAFHSSVFVWISHYFSNQFSLNEHQLAGQLFIFGFPGLLLALLMHKSTTGHSELLITRTGLLVTIAGIIVLTTNISLLQAQFLLIIMSLGFSFSQPLFIGNFNMSPACSISGRQVALGCGLLFAGYGTGPLFILQLLNSGVSVAAGFIALMATALFMLSGRLWQNQGQLNTPF